MSEDMNAHPGSTADVANPEPNVASYQPALPNSNVESAGSWDKPVLVGLFWVLAFVYVCGTTVADPDLWGHTLYGLRSIELGVLTEKTDPYSYTAPNAKWVNHEWLTEYQFGWLWKQYGGVGLWLWRNVAALGVLAIGLLAIRRANCGLAASILMLVFTAECLADYFTFIRPQLATFALFALVLTILRTHWERPTYRWIWVLPLLSGVWVNLHGGFLAGLGVQALFVAGFGWRAIHDRQSRRPFLVSLTVGLLSVAATAVNPYGIEMHTMLWDHLVPSQAVREWQPLWAIEPSPTHYLPFVLIALAMPWSRRWQWIDLFVLGLVAYQAIFHVRHVALLSIAVMVLLPDALSESLSRLFSQCFEHFSGPPARARRWAAALAIAGLFVGLHIHETRQMLDYQIRPWEIGVECHRDTPGVPVRAISVLEASGLQGNLVTSYGWGQYVLWHLHPHVKVAFDGRYRTVYPPALEREFLDFQRLDAASASRVPILDNYATQIALLPQSYGATEYLRTRQDWILVYGDDQAALYVRDLPQFATFIERARRLSPQVTRWQVFPAGPIVPTFQVVTRRLSVNEIVPE